MDTRLIFLCLFFLIDCGVFGDEVKSVSVTEGQSVTLKTDLTDVQTDGVIVWTYGPEKKFVARLDREAKSTMVVERFRDKLMLSIQTGDLIISDIRTHHSGLYTLKISSNNKVSYKMFNVAVSGVFNDSCEVKSVSVRKGHSVILHTDVLKDRDYLMEWRFGPENTFVGKINETVFTPSTDERFRDKVKLDNQTGDLMIHDIRTHHSGLYTFRININNKVLYKKFDVTIHDSHVDSGVLWVWVIPVVLLICICVCVCIWVCVRKQRAGSMKTSHLLTDDKSSINSSTMSDADASRFPSSTIVNMINTEDEKEMQDNLIYT